MKDKKYHKRNYHPSSHAKRHFIIVTDGEKTEFNYLNGLKRASSSNNVIKIYLAHTYELINKILDESSRSKHPAEPWIVFDRDEVKDLDKIVARAKAKDINVALSSPCVEAWFLAYFCSLKNFNSSKDCIEEFERIFFKVTGKSYQKNDKDIYELLNAHGDENKAIERCNRKIKELEENFGNPYLQDCSYSHLGLLIKEIKDL